MKIFLLVVIILLVGQNIKMYNDLKYKVRGMGEILLDIESIVELNKILELNAIKLTSKTADLIIKSVIVNSLKGINKKLLKEITYHVTLSQVEIIITNMTYQKINELLMGNRDIDL